MTTLHESVTAVIVAMRSHTLDGIDGGTRMKWPELLYLLGTGELGTDVISAQLQYMISSSCCDFLERDLRYVFGSLYLWI